MFEQVEGIWSTKIVINNIETKIWFNIFDNGITITMPAFGVYNFMLEVAKTTDKYCELYLFNASYLGIFELYTQDKTLLGIYINEQKKWSLKFEKDRCPKSWNKMKMYGTSYD